MPPAENLNIGSINEIELDHIGQMALQFTQGTTMGTMRGLSIQHLEAIYSVAYNLYNNCRYDDAAKTFRFLAFHNHLESKYWVGLAATQQMLKQFPQAAQTYGYAYMLDSNNPQIPLHAADCFLASGDYPNAESALHLVIELTKGKPQHAALQERAQVLLNLVQQKQKTQT